MPCTSYRLAMGNFSLLQYFRSFSMLVGTLSVRQHGLLPNNALLMSLTYTVKSLAPLSILRVSPVPNLGFPCLRSEQLDLSSHICRAIRPELTESQSRTLVSCIP